MPTFKSAKTTASLKGITAQFKKLSNKVIIGANIKIALLALLGIIVSFNKSFNPSANGWRRSVCV